MTDNCHWVTTRQVEMIHNRKICGIIFLFFRVQIFFFLLEPSKVGSITMFRCFYTTRERNKNRERRIKERKF